MSDITADIPPDTTGDITAEDLMAITASRLLAGVPRSRAHRFGCTSTGKENSNLRSNQIGT